MSAQSPSDFFGFQLQHATANQGVAVVESLYNTTYGYSSASLQCVGNCGGSFGVTSGAGGNTVAVPEPAAWMMMVAGFGAVGYAKRRRDQGGARVGFA